MLHVVLHEPEIPANTGNIARTCAATGSVLHLIKPLGFDISDKAVKRAGLDYWYLVDVRVYENLDDFFAKNDVRCLRLFSTKAPRQYDEADYPDGCYLMFGKETKGLPKTCSPRIMTNVSASPSAPRRGASTSATASPSASSRRCGSSPSRTCWDKEK